MLLNRLNGFRWIRKNHLLSLFSILLTLDFYSHINKTCLYLLFIFKYLRLLNNSYRLLLLFLSFNLSFSTSLFSPVNLPNFFIPFILNFNRLCFNALFLDILSNFSNYLIIKRLL